MLLLLIATALSLPTVWLTRHAVPPGTLRNAIKAQKMTVERAMEISQNDPYSPFRNFQASVALFLEVISSDEFSLALSAHAPI